MSLTPETNCLSHYQEDPTTLEGIADFLEDSNALPEAEAYQFIKPDLAREIILDVAEELYLRVRGDYLTASEALQWYMIKQRSNGDGSFAVSIEPDDSRHVVELPNVRPSRIRA